MVGKQTFIGLANIYWELTMHQVLSGAGNKVANKADTVHTLLDLMF